MNGWAWLLVVIGVLVLVGVTVWCVARVRRLDRLHVRIDAARSGLESALERRTGAALAVATALEGAGRTEPVRPDVLRAAVAGACAARAAGPDREAAENALGRRLAALDRAVLPAAVLEELVEAEQLLILARRVHNDAVRDTLGLRSRRLVRWLHLAGTAPLPAYFEIAEADAAVITTVPAAVRKT
ncbi:MAG: NUDIX hydrolase [Pseudonocardia sp.]